MIIPKKTLLLFGTLAQMQKSCFFSKKIVVCFPHYSQYRYNSQYIYKFFSTFFELYFPKRVKVRYRVKGNRAKLKPLCTSTHTESTKSGKIKEKEIHFCKRYARSGAKKRSKTASSALPPSPACMP